jgi:ribosomal protein L11 methyltransferase
LEIIHLDAQHARGKRMRTESGIAQISIVTSPEAEEPIAALLERIFHATACIYANVEKGHSVVTLYAKSGLRALKQRQDEIERGLSDLREIGLNLGSAEILVRKVPREDWSESWKKYFKTMQIGSSLMIKPSWAKEKPIRGQAVVVLDPGLSFGTGQHATTSFCLKEITAAARKASKPLSLLDAGCGSGILSISAAKLGYRPVEAFDFDPVAVRIARKNCRTNRVDTRVNVTQKDLTRVSTQARQKFDVICANLISDLLISERSRLLNRLAPQGLIVLAGILETEFGTVRACYEKAGLSLLRSKIEREWQSGAFRAP